MDKTSAAEYLQMVYPRIGFLDAVTITGGEPTLHKYLPDFLKELKSQGYKTKIDTNASKPQMLKRLIERKLVDYFRIFIVSPIEKYPDVTKYKIKPNQMYKSIQIIRKSNINQEWVAMPIPSINEMEDIELIAQSIKGARRFILKQFDPAHTLNPKCMEIKPFSLNELKGIKDRVAPYFHEVIIESITKNNLNYELAY
jgi:pyruvate formate lyase activating enzyme